MVESIAVVAKRAINQNIVRRQVWDGAMVLNSWGDPTPTEELTEKLIADILDRIEPISHGDTGPILVAVPKGGPDGD